MSEEIQVKSQSELINLLFDRTPYMVIAQVLAIVVVYILSDIVASVTLHAWFATLLLCICVWVAAYTLYKGSEESTTLQQKKKWRLCWLSVSFIAALTYAIGLIGLVPKDDPASIYFIGLITLYLVSISTIILNFSLSATLGFVAPLAIPVTIYLALQGTPESIIVCVVFSLFFVSTFSVLKANNRMFKNAIQLKINKSVSEHLRAQTEQYNYEVSRRDGLTGLFNRRYFYEVLDQEMGRANRNHTPLSLLLIDIDHFREYNEHYGHIEGDNRLLEVAQLLDSKLNRKGDLIARYEGGQFAYILPNSDANGAVAYASKIQKFIQEQGIEHKATKLSLLKVMTISIGVTSLPLMSRLTAKDLTQYADTALTQAKNQGRNRVKLYGDIGFDQDHA